MGCATKRHLLAASVIRIQRQCFKNVHVSNICCIASGGPLTLQVMVSVTFSKLCFQFVKINASCVSWHKWHYLTTWGITIVGLWECSQVDQGGQLLQEGDGVVASARPNKHSTICHSKNNSWALRNFPVIVLYAFTEVRLTGTNV